PAAFAAPLADTNARHSLPATRPRRRNPASPARGGSLHAATLVADTTALPPCAGGISAQAAWPVNAPAAPRGRACESDTSAAPRQAEPERDWRAPATPASADWLVPQSAPGRPRHSSAQAPPSGAGSVAAPQARAQGSPLAHNPG